MKAVSLVVRTGEIAACGGSFGVGEPGNAMMSRFSSSFVVQEPCAGACGEFFCDSGERSDGLGLMVSSTFKSCKE